jgi:hypothetical protein
MFLLVAAVGEAGIGYLAEEVPAGLVLAGDLPYPLPDLVGAFQPPRFRRCPDLLQILLGGGQQGLALAGPVGFKERVPAADQPLARVVRVGDLGEILRIEQ